MQKLTEHLEADEVRAVIGAADEPRARLLMLEQWRAGLRVSEALALEVLELVAGHEQPDAKGAVRQGEAGAGGPGPPRNWQPPSECGAFVRKRERGQTDHGCSAQDEMTRQCSWLVYKVSLRLGERWRWLNRGRSLMGLLADRARFEDEVLVELSPQRRDCQSSLIDLYPGRIFPQYL